MTKSPRTPSSVESQEPQSRVRRWLLAARSAAVVAWGWFRTFRRTRPFWGAVWLALGGYAVLHFARSPLNMVVAGGFNAMAGYLLGGGMVMFALVALFAPHYKGLVGVVGVLLALGAFIGANLGGFVIGSVLGIIGGSMIWGWGEKKPRTARESRGLLRGKSATANNAE